MKECVRHIHHSVRKRGLTHPIYGEISTQHNRICIGKRLWNTSHEHAQYRTFYNDPTRMIRVSRPPKIDVTSSTCDSSLATGAVLAKLFGRCTQQRCNEHFWNVVNEGEWTTVRELAMRLVPTHLNDAVWCIGNWTTFDSFAEPCHRALRAFDLYVHTLRTSDIRRDHVTM